MNTFQPSGSLSSFNGSGKGGFSSSYNSTTATNAPMAVSANPVGNNIRALTPLKGNREFASSIGGAKCEEDALYDLNSALLVAPSKSSGDFKEDEDDDVLHFDDDDDLDYHNMHRAQKEDLAPPPPLSARQQLLLKRGQLGGSQQTTAAAAKTKVSRKALQAEIEGLYFALSMACHKLPLNERQQFFDAVQSKSLDRLGTKAASAAAESGQAVKAQALLERVDLQRVVYGITVLETGDTSSAATCSATFGAPVKTKGGGKKKGAGGKRGGGRRLSSGAVSRGSEVEDPFSQTSGAASKITIHSVLPFSLGEEEEEAAVPTPNEREEEAAVDPFTQTLTSAQANEEKEKLHQGFFGLRDQGNTAVAYLQQMETEDAIEAFEQNMHRIHRESQERAAALQGELSGSSSSDDNDGEGRTIGKPRSLGGSAFSQERAEQEFFDLEVDDTSSPQQPPPRQRHLSDLPSAEIVENNALTAIRTESFRGFQEQKKSTADSLLKKKQPQQDPFASSLVQRSARLLHHHTGHNVESIARECRLEAEAEEQKKAPVALGELMLSKRPSLPDLDSYQAATSSASSSVAPSATTLASLDTKSGAFTARTISTRNIAALEPPMCANAPPPKGVHHSGTKKRKHKNIGRKKDSSVTKFSLAGQDRAVLGSGGHGSHASSPQPKVARKVSFTGGGGGVLEHSKTSKTLCFSEERESSLEASSGTEQQAGKKALPKVGTPFHHPGTAEPFEFSPGRILPCTTQEEGLVQSPLAALPASTAATASSSLARSSDAHTSPSLGHTTATHSRSREEDLPPSSASPEERLGSAEKLLLQDIHGWEPCLSGKAGSKASAGPLPPPRVPSPTLASAPPLPPPGGAPRHPSATMMAAAEPQEPGLLRPQGSFTRNMIL